MLRGDPLAVAVEEHQLTGPHPGRTEAQADVPGIDQVEIRQPLQRAAQRARIVEARGAGRARGGKIGVREPRGKEPRLAEEDRLRDAAPVEPLAEIAAERCPPAVGPGDLVPELCELPQSCIRLIADDEGGVDGADGDAGDPFGFIAGLVQRLVGADVIGAEAPPPWRTKAT